MKLLSERLEERATFEDERVLKEAKAMGFVPEVYSGSQTGALLREAAAALRAVEGVCVWTIDDIDESWDGSCGAKWQFTEGGPIENETRHCPQCGKTIALVPLDAAGSAEGVS